MKNPEEHSYWLSLAQVSVCKLYIKSLRKVLKVNISHVPHSRGSDLRGLGHGSGICIKFLLACLVIPISSTRPIDCMTMGTVTGRWSRNDVVGTGQGAVPPKEDVLLASCTVQTKRRVAHYISTKYFKEVLEHLKQIS